MFLVGGTADMTTSITYFSINGIIKQGVLSDKAHLTDPEELVNIFNKNFDRLLLE